MGLTNILLLFILGLFAITTTFVIDGIRTKNWKKTIIAIVIFCSIVLIMYFGLLRFIASM